jgi:enamine deaminase RidA (YjgF/YER057c/UK114 family)
VTGVIDNRLADLGIALPAGIPPIGSYVPYVISGDLVAIAGQGPARDGKYAIFGQVGTETSIERAIEAARLCFINMLIHLKSACDGDLDLST